MENQLGWDITDFGQGNFHEAGLCLFTLRNGSPENLRTGHGILYCEKIMVVDVDKMNPLYFHWVKTDDIINRGGGKLLIQLYDATEDEGLAQTEVTVNMDGVERTVRGGDTVVLSPGESITLPPYCYHSLWAGDERVLAGEVSVVNNDEADNRLYESVGRFPDIEEDEPPLYLLVGDYDEYYRAGAQPGLLTRL